MYADISLYVYAHAHILNMWYYRDQYHQQARKYIQERQEKFSVPEEEGYVAIKTGMVYVCIYVYVYIFTYMCIYFKMKDVTYM
jgi:hypothetical protein